MSKREFGLIGYPLSHSFSRSYFAEKFAKEGIDDASYENHPIERIEMFPDLLQKIPGLRGLNVTIPYKEAVIPYLDALAEDAAEIGAVNTVKRYSNGELKGFNSDIYGFAETLRRFIPDSYKGGALILGTGGASKAVKYVCSKRALSILSVSRKRGEGRILYEDLHEDLLTDYQLIINTTPLGMHPKTDDFPGIPYQALTPNHYLLDLIYNPSETEFLKRGARQGSLTKNGMEMLILQAEKSWEIWNNPHC
ncbi:MAG: shikimate dehydrogenase [Saprospiraceae bacterium]|nr:shikimate dehydrogenase [Saprospiraceae bacterium]